MFVFYSSFSLGLSVPFSPPPNGVGFPVFFLNHRVAGLAFTLAALFVLATPPFESARDVFP